jgi:hypothetical protein
LHVLGARGVIHDRRPDCTLAWSVDFGSDYLLGRGELSEDLYSLLSAPQMATP